MNQENAQHHWHQSSHIVKVHAAKRRPKNKLKTFLVESAKFLGIFAFFLVISGVFIMWPVIYAKLNYFFVPEPKTNTELVATVPANTIKVPTGSTASKMVFSDSRIVIPKIKVDAPIIFVQSTKNPDILEAIKGGVAHLAGTALPGRIGNMFITGHSSYYWWSDGKYNQVFALLPQLKAGDLVYIYYQKGEYIYKVSGSMVVKPTQVEVLDQTLTPMMSLMTCVPIGTNLKRLIVQAELVSTPPINLDKLYKFSDIPKLPTILPL